MSDPNKNPPAAETGDNSGKAKKPPAANTPAAENTGNAGKAKKPQGVMIVSCGTHRRRAGRAFGPEPVEIPLTELTKEERKAIEGDSALSVKVYE